MRLVLSIKVENMEHKDNEEYCLLEYSGVETVLQVFARTPFQEKVKDLPSSTLFCWFRPPGAPRFIMIKNNLTFPLPSTISTGETKADIVYEVVFRFTNTPPNTPRLPTHTYPEGLTFRFNRVRIENFCNFDDVTLDLSKNSNVTLFIGPNGSGKTNAFKAMWLWNRAKSMLEEGKDDDWKGKTFMLAKEEMPFVSDVDSLFHDLEKAVFSVSITVIIGAREASLGISFFRFGRDLVFKVSETISELFPGGAIAYIPPDGSVSVNPSENFASWDGRSSTLVANPVRYLRTLCFILQYRYPLSWKLIKQAMYDQYLVDLEDVTDSTGGLRLYYKRVGSTNGRLLEIASQGGGMIRTLATFVAVCHSRCQLVCLDEPDSNLESGRQLFVISWLLQHDLEVLEELPHLRERSYAQPRQIAVTSHSEHLISNISSVFNDDEKKSEKKVGPPDGTMIYVFGVRNHPVRLLDIEVVDLASITEFLRQYSLSDYHNAKKYSYVLYTEDYTDVSILQEFARLMGESDHPILDNEAIWTYFIKGNDANLALKHFKAMRRANPHIHGFILTDRVTKQPTIRPASTYDHEGRVKFPKNVLHHAWKRCEIENYIFSPQSLVNAAKSNSGLFSPQELGIVLDVDQLESRMQESLALNMAPAALSDKYHASWIDEKLSVTLEIVIGNFKKNIKEGVRWRGNLKPHFHELVRCLEANECDDEVKMVLSTMKKHYTEACDPQCLKLKE